LVKVFGNGKLQQRIFSLFGMVLTVKNLKFLHFFFHTRGEYGDMMKNLWLNLLGVYRGLQYSRYIEVCNIQDI
jgi:hypothetical protein